MIRFVVLIALAVLASPSRAESEGGGAPPWAALPERVSTIAADAAAESSLADPGAAPEQDAPPPAAFSDLSRSPEVLKACRRIKPRHLLRVRGDFGLFQGYAGAIGPQGMERLWADPNLPEPAAEAARTASLTWDRIQRVEVRGNSMSEGALIGAFILGTVGGFGGELWGGSKGWEPGLAKAAGGAVGLGVGLVIGGMVGAFIPGWHVVYWAPRR